MSSVSADSLAAFDQKVAQLGSGAAQINDFVYQHWHESNWGDLLQPAPMAVLILSNLTVVASATDFQLVEPQGGFKRVKYPDSFRASIVQLVDTGTIALETSYANFDEIQKRCAGVKPAVNNIVGLLAGTHATSQEEANGDIQRFLPRQVAQLQTAVRLCLHKAQETDHMFEELRDLTMELHESCTATQGTNEARLADAAMRQSILESQRAAVEEAKVLSQQQVDQSRESFQNAERMFKDAADKMPSGWALAGLHLVDTFSYAIRTAADFVTFKWGNRGNEAAAIDQAGRVSAADSSGQTGTTQPDSGFYQAPSIALFANTLESFLVADSIDWDLVASEESKGVRFLRNQMQLCQTTTAGSSQPSQALLKRGIKLAKDLEAIIPTRPPEKVAKVVSGIKQFASDAADFQTQASTKLDANAMLARGFAAPEARPSAASGSLVDSAVRASQAQLEAAGRQLDNAREYSQAATRQLLVATAHMGEVMGQIASLDLQKIEWDKIRTILLRAISFLCQLKACLADIVRFFHSIDALVSVTMSETVSHFIDLVNDATAPGYKSISISGVSLSNWTRQVIYQQALQAAKVARLVENVAKIYTKMYDGHVHGGVKMLLLMGQFMSGGDSERARMLEAGREIKAWALGASDGIQELILEEQAAMRGEIEERRRALQQAFAGILPPPPPALRQAIADAAQARLKEVTLKLEDAAANNPTFKPTLGMEI